MQIRMKTTMAGPEGVRAEGSVHDIKNSEAKELIDGGYAEKYTVPVAEEADDAFVNEDTEKAVAAVQDKLDAQILANEKLAGENKALATRVAELEARAAGKGSETATQPTAPQTATQPPVEKSETPAPEKRKE